MAAASRNWPSPPMFHSPAWKATMNPADMSSRGARRMIVCISPDHVSRPLSIVVQ